MYLTRTKILLFLFGAAGLILIGRLFHLQILQNETYAAQARREMLRTVRQYLPFVRGSIETGDGLVLASDQPSWDICLHYGMLSGSERYLAGLVDDSLTRAERTDQVRKAAKREEMVL